MRHRRKGIDFTRKKASIKRESTNRREVCVMQNVRFGRRGIAGRSACGGAACARASAYGRSVNKKAMVYLHRGFHFPRACPLGGMERKRYNEKVAIIIRIRFRLARCKGAAQVLKGYGIPSRRVCSAPPHPSRGGAFRVQLRKTALGADCRGRVWPRIWQRPLPPLPRCR